MTVAVAWATLCCLAYWEESGNGRSSLDFLLSLVGFLDHNSCLKDVWCFVWCQKGPQVVYDWFCPYAKLGYKELKDVVYGVVGG